MIEIKNDHFNFQSQDLQLHSVITIPNLKSHSFTYFL